MDPETPNQPLIRNNPSLSEQPNGARSYRAYKVAGITLLACVLIVGQVMTAYFLLTQKNEIKSLEDQSNKMKSDLTRGRSAPSSAQMRVPINSFAEMLDVSGMKDFNSEDKEKSASPQATDCQLEASGVKPVNVPGYRPTCDERGLYQAEQCYVNACWCVNPSNGIVIPGSTRSGRANCSTSVASGSMRAALSQPA